jgi:hypothetical protein
MSTPGQVAGLKSHSAHCVYHWHDIVSFDINVLNGSLQQFFFSWVLIFVHF